MTYSRAEIVAKAMLFECGLGFLGIIISWVANISLSDQLSLSQDAATRGVFASLPMIAMLLACYEVNWRPFVKLRQDVEPIVQKLFADCNWLELLLISFAAGLGEEVLFRGALQPLVVRWTNPWVGLSVVALLFGLAHSVSTVYFVAATIIGVYFGWLTYSYSDLVAPVVAHALYDFVALVVIQSRCRGSRSDPPAT